MMEIEYEDMTLVFFDEDYYQILYFVENVEIKYELQMSMDTYDIIFMGDY